jgi:hypothetical protein
MTISRIVSTLTVAAVLAFVPTAAMGYTGADEEVVVTETNPEPGEPFTVIVDAGAGSDEATLTITSSNPDVPDSAIEIAGTQSMTKATNASGVAEFTVTLYAEDSYTLTGYDENGNVVGRTVVVVGDGVYGDDQAPTPAGLPNVGADGNTGLFAGAGALLLAGGGAAMVFSRRRHKQLS